MARRFGHFVDKLAGNGDSEPGILKRLEDLKTVTDDLAAGQVLLTHGQDAVKAKLDAHCDADAPTWRAEGEAWGHRLDGQIAGLDARVNRLEGNDPVTRRVAD